jgi:hypothetical protein
MSRTVIDLDDADAVNRAKRTEFIDWLASGGLPDLSDGQVMAGAWRNGTA